MEQRTRRSPARWLGPLALIAVLVAVAAVVTGANDKTGGSSTSKTGTTETTSASRSGNSGKASSKPAKSKNAAHKTYVVQVGDSLTLIATKTGVTLERLQELNPDVDSQNMIAGQKIRLR